MKFIKQLTKKELVGKTVLLRLDLNVPIRQGKIQETLRLESSIPTIKYLHSRGAKIIIISHLGDDGTASLKPVVKYFQQTFPIKFINSLARLEKTTLNDGEIILLENIRRETGEKENDPTLAKRLAKLADFYINDAFSVCHRPHTSIIGLPKILPAYAGLQLEKELRELNLLLHPKTPLVVILGGAKITTKIPMLKKILPKVEAVCVGGALANTLIQAQGIKIGQSVAEPISPLIKTLAKNKKIILPLDFIVEEENKKKMTIRKPSELAITDKIMDIGPVTVDLFAEKFQKAKMIFWNGPLGWAEKGYSHGTRKTAELLPTKAYAILGGGDSVEVLRQAKLLTKFRFVSTGGGATLDYLSGAKLPGLVALEKSK